MKVKHAQSIKEAVDSLEGFLECDLYSKFRPEHKLPTGKNKKMETWYRQDAFLGEKDFTKYLNDHFRIFRKEIIKLTGKAKYAESKKVKK